MSQYKDNLDQLREVRDEFAKALEHFPDMRVGRRLAALDEILAGKSHCGSCGKGTSLTEVSCDMVQEDS
jgi:hypothetical protein